MSKHSNLNHFFFMKHKKFKNPKFLSQKINKIKSFEKIKDEHQNIKNIKRKK